MRMPRKNARFPLTRALLVLSLLAPGLLAQSITEFAIPGGVSSPTYGITAGPDGALWFTEPLDNKIGRITPAGAFTEFAIPIGRQQALTASPPAPTAPSGSRSTLGDRIGRITTAGIISEFAIPTADSRPSAIAAGPDGALWFTEESGNKIGRMTTAGLFTEFVIPTVV